MIRKHLEKLVGKERVKSVYLPPLKGKEKRKATPSAEGFLGVEGTDDEIILEALSRAGIVGDTVDKKGREITKTDLFNLGVSGRENSAEKRASLLKFLKLPENLPANSMLEVLNSLYGFEDFMKEVQEWNRE
jgi:ribonuclease M5